MKPSYFVGGTIFFGAMAALIGENILSAYFLLLLFVVLPALVIAYIFRYRRQSNGIQAAVEKLRSEKGPFAFEVPSRPALLVDERSGTIFVVGPIEGDSDAVKVLELDFGDIAQIEAMRIDSSEIDVPNTPADNEKWQIWLTTKNTDHPIVRLNIGDKESEVLELRNKLSAVLTH
jgi:hypothetical protein